MMNDVRHIILIIKVYISPYVTIHRSKLHFTTSRDGQAREDDETFVSIIITLFTSQDC